MLARTSHRADPRTRVASSPSGARRIAAAWILLLALPVPASGESVEPAAPAQPAPAEAAPDAALTGRQIYEKVLDNRFDSYIEGIRMQSGDRGGNVQETVMEVKYRSFRNETDRILSKVIMKYEAPQDVRHLGYLVINKADGSEDQFVYRPSSRRVQRINLRGEAIFGTDFAFEDIIPQEIEDATYERKPDGEIDGVPVHVVLVTPKDEADSEYSKFDVFVTREQFVPLRVLYWDRDGIELKELNAESASIASYEHEEQPAKGEKQGVRKRIWIAQQQKIVHLKLDSWTQLTVTHLDPTTQLTSRHFSERELTASH